MIFIINDQTNALILRPLQDDDIALVTRWLYVDHVAKWYLHPDHWIHELNNRHGEFRFITHFIAEVNAKPIGFCQYYDCFFAQEHEVWNDEWRVGDKQGMVYSIDYLIGAVEYLNKGYGKEIVRQLTQKVRDLGARRIIVEPETENVTSGRVLAANGYRYNGEDYVMDFDRTVYVQTQMD